MTEEAANESISRVGRIIMNVYGIIHLVLSWVSSRLALAFKRLTINSLKLYNGIINGRFTQAFFILNNNALTYLAVNEQPGSAVKLVAGSQNADNS